MSDTCAKHSFETATGVCRQCKNPYCAECLVYAFGPKKSPYCVSCALSAAGVRHQGAERNPRLRRRGLFRREVLVDPEPPQEKGFDDIQIELPSEILGTSDTRRVNRREVDPEVLAMVEETERASRAEDELVPAGRVPTDVEAPTDPLADWAESLDSPPPGVEADPWPESESTTPWPDSSAGTSF